FNKTDNYFFNILKNDFNIQISDSPDIVFFSVFGQSHMKYSCKKIFYTGENIPPPLEHCDYSFSFDNIDNIRNYRLPHYLLYDGYYDLTSKSISEDLYDRKFCNFVASNGNCKERNNFFTELSKYKKVDSG